MRQTHGVAFKLSSRLNTKTSTLNTLNMAAEANIAKEAGVTYEIQTDDLDALIDSQLQELGFTDQIDKSMQVLSSQVKQQERKQREVNKLFKDCQDMLEKFQKDINRQQCLDDKLKTEVTEVLDDSDDDVQIMEVTYDPMVKAKKSQQPTGGQQSPGDKVHLRIMTQGVPGYGQHPALKSASHLAPIAPRQPAHNEPQSRPVVYQASKQPDLAIGMKLFGKKLTEVWYKGTLVDIVNKDKPRTERKYKVKFDARGLKVLSGRNIAFHDTPVGILPVGSRVIALYRDEEAKTNAYYAGVVAEPPNLRNFHRYLVFFDDGYAQYGGASQIHKVYEQSKNVWEDIHPDSQDFIREYLQQYPERPMVRLQKGQIIKTEWNGQWWVARVQEVDASLVKMYFDADKRVEWIYRGSTRLEPLYTELANQAASRMGGKVRRHNVNVRGHRKPVVEYTRGIEEDRRQIPQQIRAPPVENLPSYGTVQYQVVAAPPQTQSEAQPGKKRSVAKKSTNKQQSAGKSQPVHYQGVSKNPSGRDSASLFQDKHAPEYIDIDEETLGERMVVEGLPIREKRLFKRHTCSVACVRSFNEDPSKYRGTNPLLIPMFCGFERQVCRQKNTGKRVILYVAPCSRRLRNIDETDYYLMMTNSRLTIDLFCFDAQLHTHTEYVPVKTFCDIKDLSYGKETVPISCVNGIDRQYPDYVEYSNQRIPAKGVQLNLDPSFLVGCDCEDGCRDRTKCRCNQLTIVASEANPSGQPNPGAGYQDRRLREQLITSIYECNSQCKCDCRCVNRVVQNGLQLRLQVFKTEKRGWGLRCLDDIPAGGFICVYAGQLLTEQGANEDGQQYGDEYLAELDYIEVVEKLKEGYESDVNEDEGIGDNDDTVSSEEDGAQDTSDSDYSGERILKRHSRRRKYEEKIGKLVLKREPSKEKLWAVKQQVDPSKKTQQWLSNIPGTGDPIIIDSDDENSKSSGLTDMSNNQSPAKAKAAVSKVVQSGGKKADSSKKNLQAQRLRKQLKTDKSESSVCSSKSSADEGSSKTEVKSQEDKMEEGFGGLMITEPTSLNTDNVDSSDDDSDDATKPSKTSEEAGKKLTQNKNSGSMYKRTTRSQTSSRFGNLPDPTSQKPVSPLKPLKINLSTRSAVHPRTSGSSKDKMEPLSTRSLFGVTDIYVMDAKSMGNIGRYLNHSCTPNVFVQNVFVDTHDLRFPWVAFFAGQFIRAGTELTWDYNYDVGSVPGKVLYCYCGSAECRGRLL